MKEKKPNKHDKCILCRVETEYDEFDHIDSRYFMWREQGNYALNAGMRHTNKKMPNKHKLIWWIIIFFLVIGNCILAAKYLI